MALETVSHLSDLVATNPTAGDPVSQGDDHIRNIKTALLADLVNNSTQSSTNGSISLPDGTCFKWGSAVTDSGGTATLTFTNAFSSAIYQVYPSQQSGAYTVSVATKSASAVSATIYTSSTGAAAGAGLTIAFFCIGKN